MQRARYHRLMARRAGVTRRQLAIEDLAHTALGLAVVVLLYSKMLGLW